MPTSPERPLLVHLDARLVAAGVRTVGALHAAGPATCRAAWGGRTGRDVWLELDGREVPPHEGAPRSVSHGRVLAPGEEPRAILRGLAVLVAERARGLGRGVRRLDCRLGEERAVVELRPATVSERVLLRAAGRAWAGRRGRGRVRALSVVGLLDEAGADEGRLFAAGSEEGAGEGPGRGEALDEAVRALRARYGRGAVRWGGTQWGPWAGQKIAFRRVP